MAAELNNLVVNEGARKEHFRRGQGVASGNGKTAGKGQKGQGAHAHTKKHGVVMCICPNPKHKQRQG